MTSRRRPPTFMPAMPWSQPGMTCALAERERERLAAVPRVVEHRAVLVERADVLHGHVVAGLGRRALALLEVLDHELGRRVAAR